MGANDPHGPNGLADELGLPPPPRAEDVVTPSPHGPKEDPEEGALEAADGAAEDQGPKSDVVVLLPVDEVALWLSPQGPNSTDLTP